MRFAIASKAWTENGITPVEILCIREDDAHCAFRKFGAVYYPSEGVVARRPVEGRDNYEFVIIPWQVYSNMYGNSRAPHPGEKHLTVWLGADSGAMRRLGSKEENLGFRLYVEAGTLMYINKDDDRLPVPEQVDMTCKPTVTQRPWRVVGCSRCPAAKVNMDKIRLSAPLSGTRWTECSYGLRCGDVSAIDEPCPLFNK